jgi:selenocysteine lyase/cysteine desulfurase
MDVIKNKLDKNNIFYSISQKEWGVLDFKKKGIDWAIRLSPHYFNTTDEINKVSEIIEQI